MRADDFVGVGIPISVVMRGLPASSEREMRAPIRTSESPAKSVRTRRHPSSSNCSWSPPMRTPVTGDRKLGTPKATLLKALVVQHEAAPLPGQDLDVVPAGRSVSRSTAGDRGAATNRERT